MASQMSKCKVDWSVVGDLLQIHIPLIITLVLVPLDLLFDIVLKEVSVGIQPRNGHLLPQIDVLEIGVTRP